MSRPPLTPARRHFEAMHRLLTLGTALLVLFIAFQFGRLNSPLPTGERATISLDLSPSAPLRAIDHRYVAATTARLH